jgi:flagellar basal-body rod modification protein FlgD
MTVSATNSTPTTAAATAAATSATGGADMAQLSGNFSTFLTLLTTQLKNQDPTSPMDSNQFTQQLVMYSQVEQQIQSNTNLKTLISQGQSQGSVVATSYLGKNVSVTNGQGSLTGGAANWSYTLNGTASTATLGVSDANGKLVYSGPAETATGSHTFAWNGKDNNGNQLNDGAYKLAITASDSAGNAVATSVASAGTVSQIDMTGATPQLVIGNMEIGVGDIAAVAN